MRRPSYESEIEELKALGMIVQGAGMAARAERSDVSASLRVIEQAEELLKIAKRRILQIYGE
jgi:hypothetical protein